MIALAKPDNRILLDTVICGDALACLRGMPDNSVDAIVTDPPAGVGFMGKDWDTFKPEYIKKGLEDLARTFKPKDNPRYGKSNYAGPAMLAGKYDYSRESKKAFIKFMTDIMTEALRVLKPGGHALVWALPRTSHWTALALEDAGFEIRDCVYHLFGSGFPKSTAIDKQIDKRKDWQALPKLQEKIKQSRLALGISQSEAARRSGIIEPHESLGGGGFMWFETGMRIPTKEQYVSIKAALNLNGECDKAFEAAEREVLQERTMIQGGGNSLQLRVGERREVEANITAPATPEAQQWQGYGTALKPAVECWWLCRKPLAEPSIAANVLKYGTGGLNVDACRVGTTEPAYFKTDNSPSNFTGSVYGYAEYEQKYKRSGGNTQGRFPSHLLLSHSIWCVPTGTKRVRGTTGGKAPIMQNNIYGPHGGHSAFDYADPDGYEQVDAYDCHESCPIRALDEQSGVRKSGGIVRNNKMEHRNTYGQYSPFTSEGYSDVGGSSRYFTNFPPDDFTPFQYCSKSSRRERNAGCEGLPEVQQRIAGHGYTVRRCPEHDGTVVPHMNNYTCGCPFVYDGKKGNNGMSATNTHPT